jgi:hypothetical protein
MNGAPYASPPVTTSGPPSAKYGRPYAWPTVTCSSPASLLVLPLSLLHASSAAPAPATAPIARTFAARRSRVDALPIGGALRRESSTGAPQKTHVVSVIRMWRAH